MRGPAVSGNPAKIAGDDWNAVRRMTEAALQGRFNRPASQIPVQLQYDGIIQVKNGTGGTLDPLSIVGVQNCMFGPNFGNFDPDAAKFSFPQLVGVTPRYSRRLTTSGNRATLGDMGRFAVLLDGAAANEVVYAMIAGVIVCKVDFEYADQPYADITDADCTKLTAREYGGAEILDKESGTGEKWALVRLGQWWNDPFPAGIQADVAPGSSEHDFEVLNFVPVNNPSPSSTGRIIHAFFAGGLIDSKWENRTYTVVGQRCGMYMVVAPFIDYYEPGWVLDT